MRRRGGNRPVGVVVIGVALVTAGLLGWWKLPRPVPVGEILADPERFANRLVIVRGTVVPSFDLPPAGGGVYRLDDGSGEIVVFTDRAVPTQGHRVIARGRVEMKDGYGPVVQTGRKERR
ncbi:MAG: hypothetical protein GX774_00115 [Armatimonadetes bacterium]|nr:hypothetical protein [Armatimonadota bacterium]